MSFEFTSTIYIDFKSKNSAEAFNKVKHLVKVLNENSDEFKFSSNNTKLQGVSNK